MIEYYKKVVFENYANFKGRARRSEYWYFQLFNLIILLSSLIIGAVIGSLFDNTFGGVVAAYIVFAIYTLLTIIPAFAVIVRRLHDVDKSGWFYFIILIPLIGSIWLLVLFFTEGTIGTNQYGSDPKSQLDSISEIGTTEA